MWMHDFFCLSFYHPQQKLLHLLFGPEGGWGGNISSDDHQVLLVRDGYFQGEGVDISKRFVCLGLGVSGVGMSRREYLRSHGTPLYSTDT